MDEFGRERLGNWDVEKFGAFGFRNAPPCIRPAGDLVQERFEPIAHQRTGLDVHPSGVAEHIGIGVDYRFEAVIAVVE